jgi:hypothetical protein
MNIFDIIKNQLKRDYTPTYGELCDNRLLEENMVRNMCTDEDYEQYNMIMESDKKRLYNSSKPQINRPTHIQKQRQTIDKNVFGIGDCVQMC